ncbi:hypothetical protein V5799_011998 [Amblyomma americanum]|uniref:Helicase C-terminal domain-containing protein n=1 Tax=Amblyomma americanum TaxID=6943 RepID=A0AAQ4EFA5_AMBAM
MSATINADKFSEYFNGAPIIRIPGKIHPVTQYFLEDLVADNLVPQDALRKAASDPVRIVPEVLTFIMETKPPGAVLCFLPGWSEITWVRNELCKVAPARFHEWILPLHSQLRYREQQRIFETPPPDVRKVILCTNLAETSITVDDVVYVVDAGLQREQRFCPSTGISLLGTFPTSQASARQRMGRAGRLRPGESYHLYTRTDLASREQFALPEMQATDLTRVVLDCKLFCPSRNVKDILVLAPDPPTPERIEKAIKDLQGMGMMDANEELTDLGHYVIHFATAPQLAKAIIYSALFGCLDPVVAIAAILSESAKLFNKDTQKTSKGKQVKACYEQTQTSDHIALSQIFDHWNFLGDDPDEQQSFCRHNALNAFCLELSKGQCMEFEGQLMRCMRVDPSPVAGEKEWGLAVNSRSDRCELTLAVLTAGLYPNVLRVLNGRIQNSIEFACLDQRRATISEESLLHRVPPVYEHPWLVYYSALQPSKHQLITMYDCSMVSSLHLLLFAGQGVHIIEDYIFDARSQAPTASNKACLIIDEQQLLTFRCSKRDADLLWRWRRMLDYMLDLHLSLDENIERCAEETYLRRELWPRIVDATAALLSQHQSGRS